MSIDQPNVIDFLVHDKRAKRAALVISDHLDWESDGGEHLMLLQDKLNHYIWFFESGKKRCLKSLDCRNRYSYGANIR